MKKYSCKTLEKTQNNIFMISDNGKIFWKHTPLCENIVIDEATSKKTFEKAFYYKVKTNCFINRLLH